MQFGRYGIAVCRENEEEIEKLMKAVNGRAKTWTAGYSEIAATASEVRSKLTGLGFSLDHFRGTVINCATAGPSSSSYPSRVIGTEYRLQIVAGKVHLTSARTAMRNPKQKAQVKYFLPEIQIDALKARAVKDFNVLARTDPIMAQAPVAEFEASREGTDYEALPTHVQKGNYYG